MVSKKSLENSETKYMCTGLSFVIRLHNNVTNRIFSDQTAENY